MANLFLAAGFLMILLWVLGLLTSYTMGGAIHILLVSAFIFIIMWLAFGRRSFSRRN